MLNIQKMYLNTIMCHCHTVHGKTECFGKTFTLYSSNCQVPSQPSNPHVKGSHYIYCHCFIIIQRVKYCLQLCIQILILTNFSYNYKKDVWYVVSVTLQLSQIFHIPVHDWVKPV